MKRELKVCDVESYLPTLEQIDDPFVQEVLHFWKIQNRKGYIYFVPSSDKEPRDIASFILLEKKKDWSIRGTWTDPRYRNLGLSSFIIQHIISEFKLTHPFDYLWVNITPGAENFYLKNKFHIYGKRTDCEPNMNVGVYSSFSEKEERQRFIEKYTKHVLE